MNVNLAKNLVILFFVVLNIILFGVLYLKESRYQISEKQLKNITTMLSENNISLYTKPIMEFKPMRQLKLSQNPMDIEYIIEWLFPDGDEVTRKEEFDRIILTSGAKTLSYDYKQYIFENPGGNWLQKQNVGLSLESARSVCEQMLSGIENNKRKFVLDREIVLEDGVSITLEYRMKFENYIIYTSFVKFKVTEKGVVQIKASIFEPTGFSEAPREIYSPDEALLALMYELQRIYGKGTSVIIKKMEIVYYADAGLTSEGLEIKAIPCYRIYVSDRQEPFLLNAYFNTFIR